MDLKRLLNIYSKFFIVIIFILTGFFLFASGIGSGVKALADESEVAEDENEFDTIIINNEYEKDRKGPVTFAHKKHARDYQLLCWECHHEYDNDGKNDYSPWGTTESCSSCHDPSTKDGNIMKLQTAYHVNCKTCHEEMKIFGDEPFVYRKCTKCHEKTE